MTKIDNTCLLEVSPLAIHRQHYLDALGELLRGSLPMLGKDRNAFCYLYQCATVNGRVSLVIKQSRSGAQRSNPDQTFANEARALALVAKAGILGVPDFHARAQVADQHYLLVGYRPGEHPCPLHAPFTTPHLEQMVGQLAQLDSARLMHYDLNPRNLLIDAAGVSIIDFEFAREEVWEINDSPARLRHLDDFNVTTNPYFPTRSNLANFEFRTLHGYIAQQAEAHGASVEQMMSVYLQSRAQYHEMMADQFAAFQRTIASSLDLLRQVLSGISKAIKHEQAISRLMRHPGRSIISAEYLVMGFRRTVFETGPEAAHKLQSTIATLRSIHNGAGRADIDSYFQGLIEAVTRVSRSWAAFPRVDRDRDGSGASHVQQEGARLMPTVSASDLVDVDAQ